MFTHLRIFLATSTIFCRQNRKYISHVRRYRKYIYILRVTCNMYMLYVTYFVKKEIDTRDGWELNSIISINTESKTRIFLKCVLFVVTSLFSVSLSHSYISLQFFNFTCHLNPTCWKPLSTYSNLLSIFYHDLFAPCSFASHGHWKDTKMVWSFLDFSYHHSCHGHQR